MSTFEIISVKIISQLYSSHDKIRMTATIKVSKFTGFIQWCQSADRPSTNNNCNCCRCQYVFHNKFDQTDYYFGNMSTGKILLLLLKLLAHPRMPFKQSQKLKNVLLCNSKCKFYQKQIQLISKAIAIVTKANMVLQLLFTAAVDCNLDYSSLFFNEQAKIIWAL
ncbi:hypothetical protein BDA99DRAFT_540071 [Phascolomyces articulosus]|uniref:Uncharacterized protein n=1 Tax=Phascolomyces articulosus TaxID=60185 RepID=A0AAD5K7Z6_9FUNG|nr:hypothetical protein BDA99DRAFT_540071 [Phascolomyces articulosus]